MTGDVHATNSPHSQPPDALANAIGADKPAAHHGQDTHQNAVTNWLHDAWGSFQNSGINQINGFTQLTNKVSGSQIGEVKTAQVDDPNKSWGAWTANLVGQSAFIAAEFVGMRKLGAAAKALKFLTSGGEAEAVAASSQTGLAAKLAGKWSSLSEPSRNLIYSGGFGAGMGFLATPVTDQDHFWKEKLLTTGTSTISMLGMTKFSTSLQSRLGSALLNSESPGLARSLTVAIGSNFGGGYAGGALGELASEGLHGQAPDWKQINRAGVEFGLIGVGTHGINVGLDAAAKLPEQRTGTDMTNARYIAGKLGWKLGPDSGRQAEFRVTGGQDQLARVHEQLQPGTAPASAQAEVRVQQKLHGLFGDKWGTARSLLVSHGMVDAAATARADLIANCLPFTDSALLGKDVFGGRSQGRAQDQPVWLSADKNLERLVLTRGSEAPKLPDGFLDAVRLGEIDPKNPQYALYVENGEVKTAHILKGSPDKPPIWLGEFSADGLPTDVIGDFGAPGSTGDRPPVHAIAPPIDLAKRLPQATWHGPDGDRQVFFGGDAAEINGVKYVWIESPTLPLGRKGVPAESVEVQREPTQHELTMLGDLKELAPGGNNIETIMPVYEMLAKTPGIDEQARQLLAKSLADLRNPESGRTAQALETIEAITGFYHVEGANTLYDVYLNPGQRAFFEEKVRPFIESEGGYRTPDAVAQGLIKLVGNDPNLKLALRHYARSLQSDIALSNDQYAHTLSANPNLGPLFVAHLQNMLQARPELGNSLFQAHMQAHLADPRNVMKPRALVHAEAIDRVFQLLHETPTNAAALVGSFGGRGRTLEFSPEDASSNGGINIKPTEFIDPAQVEEQRAADAASGEGAGVGARARATGETGANNEPPAPQLSPEATLALARMRDPATAEQGTLELAMLMNQPAVAERFSEWRTQAIDVFPHLGTEELRAVPDDTVRTLLFGNLTGTSPEQMAPVLRERIASLQKLATVFKENPTQTTDEPANPPRVQGADNQQIIARIIELAKNEPAVLSDLVDKLSSRSGNEIKAEIIRRLSASSGTPADINAAYLSEYVGFSRNRSIKDLSDGNDSLRRLSNENPAEFISLVKPPFPIDRADRFAKPKPGEAEAQKKRQQLNDAYSQLINLLAPRAHNLQELIDIGKLAKARSTGLKPAAAQLVPKGSPAWVGIDERISALLDNNPKVVATNAKTVMAQIKDLEPRPETDQQRADRLAKEAAEKELREKAEAGQREEAEKQRLAAEAEARQKAEEAERQRLAEEEAQRRKSEAEANATGLIPEQIDRLIGLDKEAAVNLSEAEAAQIARAVNEKPIDQSTYVDMLKGADVQLQKSLEGNWFASFEDEASAQQFAQTIGAHLPMDVKAMRAVQDTVTGRWVPVLDVEVANGQHAVGIVSLDDNQNVVGLGRFAGEHAPRLRAERQAQIDAEAELLRQQEAQRIAQEEARARAEKAANEAKARLEQLGADGVAKLAEMDRQLGTTLSDEQAEQLAAMLVDKPLDRAKYDKFVSRDDVQLEPLVGDKFAASFPTTQSAKGVADYVENQLMSRLHPYSIETKKVPDPTDSTGKRRIAVIDMTLRDPITGEAGEHVVGTIAFDAEKNIVGLARFAGNNPEALIAELTKHGAPEPLAAEPPVAEAPPAEPPAAEAPAADPVRTVPTYEEARREAEPAPAGPSEDIAAARFEEPATPEFAEVVTRDTKIENVPPIQQSSVYLREREQIPQVVEAPLVPAAEALYDKNVRTIMSGANYQDVRVGRAHILIDYEALSPENKAIAEKVGEITTLEGDKIVNMTVPIHEGMTVGEIQDAMLELANKFERQPLNWGYHTPEELYRVFTGDSTSEFTPELHEAYTNQEWLDEIGMHYDANSDLVFGSKELAQKYAESHPREEAAPPASPPVAQPAAPLAPPEAELEAPAPAAHEPIEPAAQPAPAIEIAEPAAAPHAAEAERDVPPPVVHAEIPAGMLLKYTGEPLDAEFDKQLTPISGDARDQSGMRYASLKDEDEAGLLSIYAAEKLEKATGATIVPDQPTAIQLGDGTYAPVLSMQLPSGEVITGTPSFDAEGKLTGLAAIPDSGLPVIKATEPAEQLVAARTQPGFADGVANSEVLKELSKKAVAPTDEERHIFGKEVEKRQFKQKDPTTGEEHVVRSYWLPVDEGNGSQLRLVGRTIDGVPTTLASEHFAEHVGLSRKAAIGQELYPTRETGPGGDVKVTELPKGLLQEFDGPKAAYAAELKAAELDSENDRLPGEGKGAVVYSQTLKDAANNNQPYEISKVIYPGGLKLTVDAAHSTITGELPGGARFIATELHKDGSDLVSNNVRYTGLGVDAVPPPQARMTFNPNTYMLTFEAPASETAPSGFKMTRTADGALTISGKFSKAAVSADELEPARTTQEPVGQQDPSTQQGASQAPALEEVKGENDSSAATQGTNATGTAAPASDGEPDPSLQQTGNNGVAPAAEALSREAAEQPVQETWSYEQMQNEFQIGGIPWAFKEVNAWLRTPEKLDASAYDILTINFDNAEATDRGFAATPDEEKATDLTRDLIAHLQEQMGDEAEVSGTINAVPLEGVDYWVPVIEVKILNQEQDVVRGVVAVDTSDSSILGLAPLSGELNLPEPMPAEVEPNDGGTAGNGTGSSSKPDYGSVLADFSQSRQALRERQRAEATGSGDGDLEATAPSSERAQPTERSVAAAESVAYQPKRPLRFDEEAKRKLEGLMLKNRANHERQLEFVDQLISMAKKDGNVDIRRTADKLGHAKFGEKIRDRLEQLLAQEASEPGSVPVPRFNADYIHMELRLPEDYKFMPGVADHLLALYANDGRQLFNVMTPPQLPEELENAPQTTGNNKGGERTRPPKPPAVELRYMYRDVMGVLSTYADSAEQLNNIARLVKPRLPRDQQNDINAYRKAMADNAGPLTKEVLELMRSEHDANWEYVQERLAALAALNPEGIRVRRPVLQRVVATRAEDTWQDDVQRRAEAEAALLRSGAYPADDEEGGKPGGRRQRNRRDDRNRGRRGRWDE